MKILLIKDVYKLGRAGEVKKVANGYGRNYLIPQGLAVLATPGALSQADRIRTTAEVRRAVENQELSGIAEQLSELELVFAAKAGETGKLYGSVTAQMISDAIKEAAEVEVDRRQIDSQPIRMLGVHKVNVRLTLDLIPEIRVLVHREGEPPESALAFVEGEEVDIEAVETTAELEDTAEEAEQVEAEELADDVEMVSEDELVESETAAELEYTAEETEDLEAEEPADEVEMVSEAELVESETAAELEDTAEEAEDLGAEEPADEVETVSEAELVESETAAELEYTAEEAEDLGAEEPADEVETVSEAELVESETAAEEQADDAE
jgi:large subunit ribosomal protein L9